MNNTLIYHPYKDGAIMLPFTALLGILAFVVAGYFLSYNAIGTIFLSIVGVVCMWFSKILYDSAKKVVLFEPRGLRITGGSYRDYCYIEWDTLSYAYYEKNFKGHLFLVLSPRELGPKDTKRFANRSANLSRICIDDVVVIHISMLQNDLQIEEMVKKHVKVRCESKTGDGFA